MTERDSRETERRGVIRVRPSGAEDKGEGEKIEWIWGLGFQPGLYTMTEWRWASNRARPH